MFALRRTHIFALAALITLALTPITEAFSAGAAKPLTGAAREKEISRKINVLGNIAYGVQVHKMTFPIGSKKIGQMMVFELAGTQGIDEDSFLVDLKSKDFDFADMSSWGTTDLDSAKDLFAMTDDNENDQKKVAKRETLGADILGELKAMGGVSFGFTSSSSGYCGVGFMGLLIVDEENGLIYEIALTDSGSC